MNSRQIRQEFLDFFSSRGHREVASSPLILPNDPTLLFANAGMNQFKDVFTGREHREYTRAASSQKCLRVSGKHNDLEMVGRTPRHHTFFEMLGNFSFGDYFKEDAIKLAWELVTQVYGVDKDRLWVSVFGGSERVGADEEAETLWKDAVGFPAERILRLGESENFWRMGDTGPCGPCSEIHYDLGEAFTSVQGPSTPETDDNRFLEIWNLVFMQFDQKDENTLEPLPSPSIDTGMGLERIASVIQGKFTNYDTDLFMPILEAAAKRAGTTYGTDPEKDFSMRVIADHARALCFLVADGVAPANDRRGYVLRRLLRRAIRHGRKLGIDGPFLEAVTPVVLDGLSDVYPELLAARDAIVEIGRREEQQFAETLSTGLGMLETALADLGTDGADQRVLGGKELFRLYDTFGFPLDLARDIAEERGVRLDEEGFESEMAGQRKRAQASFKAGGSTDDPSSYAPLAARFTTSFEGYSRTRVDGARILAILRDGQAVDGLIDGEEGELVLDATPFYAESGGQVSDTGILVGAEGRAEVVGVTKPGGLFVHRVRTEAGRVAVGDTVAAEIDEVRRAAVMRNHTATHLLHAALREVVGTHVKQAGSLVAPDRLRFDFAHFTGVSDRALADIESLANRKVLDDLPIETEQMDLNDALRSGAMALFGEKYGDRVRVVTVGEFSTELCGGTHCARTGEIGLIKLTQERGIASGTRRVEAVSGEGSLDRFRREHAIVKALEDSLSVTGPKILEEVDRRLEQLRALERQLDRQRVGDLHQRLAAKAEDPQVVAGVRLVVERVDGVAAQDLRELADNLRQKLRSGVVVLGRADEAKVSLLVAVTPDLKGKLPAGQLVKELAPIIGGGGGGRPDLAEAGGKDPSRLDEALAQAAEVVKGRME